MDQFGDPVAPDEPVEVTFDVHRITVGGEHKGSHDGTAVTEEDGLATFTYDQDAGSLGTPHDSALTPLDDGADRDSITACVEDSCSEIVPGEASEDTVAVRDGVDTYGQVELQWVMPDSRTAMNQTGDRPGFFGMNGTLFTMLGWDTVANGSGELGAVAEETARAGGNTGQISWRTHLRTGLFQFGGEVSVTSPLTDDAPLTMHPGGQTDTGPALLEIPREWFVEIDPNDELVIEHGQLRTYELGRGVSLGGEGDFKIQDRLAAGDLALMGGQLLGWVEEVGIDFSDPDFQARYAVPAPPIDFYFQLATEANPEGELRGQLPIGTTKGSGALFLSAFAFDAFRPSAPPVFRQVDDAGSSATGVQELELTFDMPVRNPHGEPFTRALTGEDFTATVNGEEVGVGLSSDQLADWAQLNDSHTISIDRELEFGDQFTVTINSAGADVIVGGDTTYVGYPAGGGMVVDFPIPMADEYPLATSVKSRSWTVGHGHGELAGTVTAAATDEPLSDVEVVVYTVDDEGEPEAEVASGTSGTDGSYSFRVPAGEGYTVIYNLDGYSPLEVDEVDVDLYQTIPVDSQLHVEPA